MHAAAVLGRDPASTVIACDFDGTLSPIVDDPAAARPLAESVAALGALVERFATVAVISGRPRRFLEQHLPAGVDLFGLYGLEWRRGGVVGEPSAAAGWRAAVDQVAVDARDELPPDVVVEPKGLSLTIHYRTSPSRAALVGDVAERLAAGSGLELRPARMSVELHPPVQVDKGTVLLDLADGRGAACFIGDDAGDLDAFDALDELAGRGVATVRIAVASPESPAALLARADVVLDGPVAVAQLLQSL